MPEQIDFASEVMGKPAKKPDIDFASEIFGRLPERQPAEISTEPGVQGLQGVLPRGQMAMLGDTAAEKRKILRKYYPQADVIRDEDGELLFNLSPDQPYRKIDPSIWTDVNRLEDLPEDIAEGAAIVPVLAAELGLFGLFRNPTGLAGTLTAMLGGAVGETARQGAKTASGVQELSAEQQAGQIAEEAMLGGAGEVAAKPVIAAVRGLKGAANIRLREGAKKAQGAAQRLGLTDFTPGQLSESPLIRRLEAQSRAMSGAFERVVRRQRLSAQRKLRNIALQAERRKASFTENLTKAVNAAEDRVLSRLRDRNASDAGTAIQSGVVEWDELKRAEINALYNEAREMATPVYDISDILDTANELSLGVVGQTRRGQQVRVSADLQPTLGDVIAKIRTLDPSLPTVETDGQIFDATEQLKVLRSQLWDLKTPDAGEIARQPHKDAARLYNAITDAMNNPRLDNEGAAAAWRKAAQAANDRFNTWDLLAVANAKRTQQPARLAASLLRKDAVDDVRTLKGIVPQRQWTEFQDYAGGEIARNPKLLGSIDKSTLLEIFGREGLDNVKGIASDLSKLRAPKWNDLAQKGYRNRQLVQKHLDDATPAEVEAFRNALKEAGDPQALTDVKAALIDRAVERVFTQAGQTTTSRALNNILFEWRDNGLIQLFDKTEIRTLRSLVSYLKVTERSIDTGTSLVTAGVVGKMKRLPLEALTTVLHTIGVGRLLMSKPVRRFLLGQSGRSSPNLASLRAFMAAIASSLDDMGPQPQEKSP